jgi:regulator of protease activity HflC (stomatin/prohibitin superfamily)
VGDKELPVLYLLGERYVTALQQMATSQNSKLVMIPGDLPASIKSLLGSFK